MVFPGCPIQTHALIDYRDRPAPVPRHTYYGLKNRDFEDLNTDLATFKFEHDFNDGSIAKKPIAFRQFFARFNCHAAALCR